MSNFWWVEPTVVTTARFSAEFYSPKYLTLETQLLTAGRKYELKSLNKLGKLFTGPFGSKLPTSVYVDDGIPLLRVQNIGEFEVLQDNLAQISLQTHQEIIKSKLRSGDLAIAKAGRIGTTAIIPPSIRECNITQHVVGMRVNSNEVRSYYLAAFLMSKYGRFQLKRQGIGTLLKYLGIEDTRRSQIVLPPRLMQDYIGAKVRLAEQLRAEAKRVYEEALNILYTLIEVPTIDLESRCFDVPSNAITSVRLDPKYYRPVYLSLEQAIFSFNDGSTYVRDFVKTVSNGIEYREFVSAGRPYLTVSDINHGRLQTQSAPKIPLQAPVSPRGELRLRDLLVVRTGSIGQATYVRSPDKDAVISSHFIKLRLREPSNAPWLAFYLNSTIGKLLQERISYGAVQAQISQKLLLELPVPCFNGNTKYQISSRVEKNCVLLDYADDLIAQAKSDVEALIEGHLDTNAIFSGQLKPPTWEDVIRDVEAKL